MFKVVTTDGHPVNGYVLSEVEAKADAVRRNRRAEALGIETRYEVKATVDGD